MPTVIYEITEIKSRKKKLWIFQGSNFYLFDVQERHH